MRSTKEKQAPKTGKNPIAQCLIIAMEKPPKLTHEDRQMNVKSSELIIPFLRYRAVLTREWRENHE